MDIFKEAKDKHDINTCQICISNIRYRDNHRPLRVLALDGIHVKSLVDDILPMTPFSIRLEEIQSKFDWRYSTYGLVEF